MKQSREAQPDEAAYNIVIHGCGRLGMYERGIELLRRMEAEGVPPSNYTLSVLVKLASRAKHLTEAFALCQELPRKYGFKPNAHVFANLIQGCVLTRSWGCDR